MKNGEKLMKNLRSSDINTMLQRSMNVPGVCLGKPCLEKARLEAPRLGKPGLETPLTTALIWGLNISVGPDTAIWGTAAVGATSRKQNFTAIWGTAGVWAPKQYAGVPLPPIELGS